MGLFNKKNGGFADIIRCDEPSYLIWKWHPAGVATGENNRENAIRHGSILRVKDGEVAVFVYKQSGRRMQDFIVGPFDQKIETKNFPVLASIIGLAFEGGTPFQAEVYFINTAKIVQTRFAVPFFTVYDPTFAEFGVPVSVRGTVNFQIEYYEDFVKYNKLHDFSVEDFELQIRDAVAKYVKAEVANAPFSANIPVVQIERKTEEISNIIEDKLRERLKKDFCVKLTGLDIATIEIDKFSDDYKSLTAITKDLTKATAQAQTEAAIEHYKENLRIQREEDQYAKHMKTKTENLEAYQTEQQSAVGIATANAFGQMGANNAANVEIGNGGTGFNPVAMMAGMAMGNAMGQNLSGIMNGFTQQAPTGGMPNIPTTTYYVAVNGQAIGPYDIETLKKLATVGQFTNTSMVWKQGMTAWVQAADVNELKLVFNNTMPPIPTK